MQMKSVKRVHIVCHMCVGKRKKAEADEKEMGNEYCMDYCRLIACSNRDETQMAWNGKWRPQS